MRSLLLLFGILCAAFASKQDYEPNPELRREPRSHLVKEYSYYEEEEEPELIDGDLVWPSEGRCHGCRDNQPNQRYPRMSPYDKNQDNTNAVHDPPINNQSVQNQKEESNHYPTKQPIQSQNAPSQPNHQPSNQRPIEPFNQASTLQQHIIRGKKIKPIHSFAGHQPISLNQQTYHNRLIHPYEQPINQANQFPNQRIQEQIPHTAFHQVNQPNQYSNLNTGYQVHTMPEQVPHSVHQPIYLARVNAPNQAPTYQAIPYQPAYQFVAALHPDPLTPVSGPVPPLRASSDQASAAGHLQPQKHLHSHVQGGGRGAHAKFHKIGGEKATESFHKDHHVDKGGKGEKVEEVHKKEYEEAGGLKKKHHDHAGHKGNHEEEAHGHRGAKFDEKKGHKKGHKTKGYHNKYHKDEFHKEHKFYDDYHKSGEHHRFGKFNAKHASNESGKKKAHHVDAGHDYVEKGKKGYSNKGHVDADHKGYTGKHGHEEHHKQESSHGKKGGREGGAQWAYAKKN